MKKSIFLIAFVAIAMVFTNCTSVGPKERGVKVKYGGKPVMDHIYQPGQQIGFNWLWDDMETFDVSQQTVVEKFSFNDAKNMETGVEVSVDFNLDETKVNYMLTNVTDWKIKLSKTIKSAAKEVVPQYTASDLNLTKRAEAEEKLADILRKELPEFYLVFSRIQITDVDIPVGIAQAAEATAKQDELNKLALSRAIQAENNYKAAEWDAKTKDILSQPAMLKLKELEIQETQAKADLMWASKGSSRYGTGNVFGQVPNLLFQR